MVELTETENQWYSRILEHSDHDEWPDVADASESLMESLLSREAIPEVRLNVFCNPEYAEKGNKSPQQIFKLNGKSGADIFRHPNFILYLHYLIGGPDLPKSVIEGLCKILNDDMGTSGMLMDQYRAYARYSIRQYRLDRKKAATEFFRLGVEIGMDIHAARTLRDAAMSTH